jgi:hydroxyacylglutathione hydrolase
MSKPVEVLRLAAFADNYLWLIHNQIDAIVVDPGDADIIISALEQHDLTLSAILVTHHHSDHTGGLEKLLDYAPKAHIFGAALDNIKFVKHALYGNEELVFEELNLNFKVIAVPGHTLGHIAYYEANHGWLFCGDTLFGGGCGRVFEGTYAQMYQSLQNFIELPDETLVFCAHEYTLSNLLFALQTDPNNVELQKRLEQTHDLRKLQQATVPSSLGLEKRTNPFLRSNKNELRNQLLTLNKINENANVLDVFTALRTWKNNV